MTFAVTSKLTPLLLLEGEIFYRKSTSTDDNAPNGMQLVCGGLGSTLKNFYPCAKLSKRGLEIP